MTMRLKIIVAEDNPVQRGFLTQLINNLGHEAIPAEDGLTALKLVQDNNAQILLSSYQIKHLNGIELTRKVRALVSDHYVHIIIITGSEEDDVRKEALVAGVDDFMNKTSSPIMLKARIRAASRLIRHAMELAERSRIIKESSDRIEQDLRAAADAQRQLLPPVHENILGVDIAFAFVPSSFVSGDMFGCLQLDDRKLGFYAVDVSGHGVHASLLSVAIGHLITREFFETKTLKTDGTADPAALVADLNYRFSGGDNDDYFSMFCGVLDTVTGQLDYCQAGSPMPFYVQKSGNTALVGDGGFLVGMFSEAIYENNMITIEPGGSLVMCSDAVSEAENETQCPFGTDRLLDIIATGPQIGTQNIPAKIMRALAEWRGNQTLEDDLTIVALERTIPHDT